MNNKVERRKFKRWSVSIPCTIESDDFVLEATIENLYYGGARIVDMSGAPPEGSLATVSFQFHDGEQVQDITLPARVVYAVRSILDGRARHSIGLEFLDPLAKIAATLTPLFLRLRRDDLKNRPGSSGSTKRYQESEAAVAADVK